MRQGLLVGVGSVGKHHAKVMAERHERLLLVDPSPEVEDWLKGQIQSEYKVFGSLSEAIAALSPNASSTTAVSPSLQSTKVSPFSTG